MNWFRGDPNKTLARAATVESVAKSGQTLLTGATAIGVTAAIASGPALPVVAGVAVVAAYGLRLYAQNKKLAELFKRTYKLVNRMIPVIDKMETASRERMFEPKLDLTDVRKDAEDIQKTIGELIGTDTLNEIQQQIQAGQNPIARSASLSSKLNRLGRILSPGATMARFNEQLTQLALDFSVVQGEFAVQLERLTPAVAKQIADAPTSTVTPVIDPAKQGAANTSEVGQPVPSIGGRSTRRRRRAKKTRKNLL